MSCIRDHGKRRDAINRVFDDIDVEKGIIDDPLIDDLRPGFNSRCDESVSFTMKNNRRLRRYLCELQGISHKAKSTSLTAVKKWFKSLAAEPVAVKFAEANKVYYGEGCYDLHAHFSPEQHLIICCWKLSLWSRIKMLFTGKMWHLVSSNSSIQPVSLTHNKPFEKPVKPGLFWRVRNWRRK